MENETQPFKKFTFRRIHLNEKSRYVLAVIGTSVLSTLIVLAIAGFVLWHYRSRIIASLATTPIANQIANSNESIPSATGVASVPPASDLSVTDVVAKANKSVVSIEVYQNVPTYADSGGYNPFGDLFPGFFVPNRTQTGTQSQKVGGGTGFFVTADGLIVTNRHVVDFDGATFKAITVAGKSYNATVIAKDPVLDIALLRVTGTGFTPVTLGNSDTLQLGQSVVAIGYALGQFNNSISTGVISGLSRTITAGDESGASTETLDKVIQTDAAINPGNSGGPLLNLKGEVIGVDVAVAQGSQNIGFALPINSVKAAIESVKNTGTIVRPYVGIRYVPITADISKANNLPYDYGILIKGGNAATDLAVIPGSPADKAGLTENDIILAVNGTKLDDSNSFASIIRNYSVGQTISLDVWSKGVRKNVSLSLAKAPN